MRTVSCRSEVASVEYVRESRIVHAYKRNGWVFRDEISVKKKFSYVRSSLKITFYVNDVSLSSSSV